MTSRSAKTTSGPQAPLAKGLEGGQATPARRTIPQGSSAEVQGLRSGFGLNREKFSRLSGFSVRGLANWEAGVQRPSEQARLRLTELSRLHQALARVIPATTIGDWLDTPNPAFGGLKPLEVIERGQVDRLWQMIFLLESGAPS